ncbi:MAG: DUF5103 domain-containing protein [Saprospiraceae bacterium]
MDSHHLTIFPNRVRLIFVSLSLMLALPQMTYAGPGEFETVDHVYQDFIKTVKFSLSGLPNTMPITQMGTGELNLSFDDLQANFKDIRYRIVHCDMDWNPSDLQEQDYISGFNDELVRDFSFSSLAVQNYTHYELFLPNKDLSWKLSGNYLLHLYQDDNKQPLITRRFCVVEPIMKLFGGMVTPYNATKYNTHHELDFRVQMGASRMINPMLEVRATILQNNRWDKAIQSVAPNYIMGEDLQFKFQDKITFEAGKEFRPCDIRSAKYKSEFVNNLELTTEGFYAALRTDKPRSDQNYLSRRDINGSFVLENADRPGDDALNSEYIHVLFRLQTPEDPMEDFYVIGAFCDWTCSYDNKMVYDEKTNCYIANIFLKQGYYDYIYAMSAPDKCNLDSSELEGNWYETENTYNILIYYRQQGERYDRLVANGAISSK